MEFRWFSETEYLFATDQVPTTRSWPEEGYLNDMGMLRWYRISRTLSGGITQIAESDVPPALRTINLILN